MKYACLNNISEKGLQNFTKKYHLTDKPEEAEMILVRSQNMHEFPINEDLIAVARAGAGVNNIPLDKMGQSGVVVFNAPGANSNAVKELVIASLLLASRDIVGGINWVQANKEDEEIAKNVEKAKKQFAGTEITGKTISVIGLGAVGSKVANACALLGMEVLGYDPFLSKAVKDNLHPSIKIYDDLFEMYKLSDFVTLHLPLLDATRQMINEEVFKVIKKGCIILNFSRDLLVNDVAIKEALEEGIIKKYITDFPNKYIANVKNVVGIPHLGASTVESEDNCAIMVVDSLMKFYENGSIINSVNYPNVELRPQDTKTRLLMLAVKNPELYEKIDQVLAEYADDIRLKINKTKNDYAYFAYDIEKPLDKNTLQEIKQIVGIYKVRVISQ